MMKFIDWLNSKTGLKVRDQCDFECTYIWASLLYHLVLLAFIVLVLFVLGFFAYLIVFANLIYFGVVDLGIKVDEKLNLLVIIFCVDISVIVLVGLFFHTKLNKLLTKVLNKFCKRLDKED